MDFGGKVSVLNGLPAFNNGASPPSMYSPKYFIVFCLFSYTRTYSTVFLHLYDNAGGVEVLVHINVTV